MRPPRGTLIPLPCPLERQCFRVAHQSFSVQCHAIDVCDEAETTSIERARRHLRESDCLEHLLNKRQHIRARPREPAHASREHLLGAAPGWNQTNTHFDKADITFSRRLQSIAVQRDLAASADRQSRRCDDDRDIRIPQALGRVLERADHQVDFVPVALLRLE